MATPLHRALWAPLSVTFHVSIRYENLLSNIFPPLLLLGWATVSFHYYFHQLSACTRIALSRAKLNVAIGLLVIEVFSLASQMASAVAGEGVPMATLSVSALAALSLVAVFSAEDHQGIRAPRLLRIYAACGIWISTVKCICFYDREAVYLGGAAAISAGAHLALLALEQLSRWGFCSANSMNASQENQPSSSLWSSLTFFVNPVPIMLGADIKMDVVKKHEPGVVSKLPHSELKYHWQREDRSCKNSILFASLKTWKGCVLALFLTRFILMCVCFAEPFVMYSVINAVNQPESPLREKIACLCAFSFVYCAGMVSRFAVSQLQNNLQMNVRAGLIALSYEKSQKLTSAEAQRSTTLPLLDTALQSALEGLTRLHIFLFALPTATLGIYFLYFFIGRSSLAIFVPIILSIVRSRPLSSGMYKTLKKWKESAAARVQKTSEILPQLPSLRMIGLGPSTAKFLAGFMSVEVDAHARHWQMLSISSVVSVAIDVSTPIFVIGVAVLCGAFDGKLQAAVIFPALSLIYTAKDGCVKLADTSLFSSFMVDGFEEFRTFLQLKEREDGRVLGPHQTSSSQSTTSVVQFSDVTFVSQHLEFAQYQHIDFALVRGSFTAVLGKVAAERTSILESIMGETSIMSGSIYVDAVTIGYSGEFVFLRNVSIRENIIGLLPYEHGWFDAVIRCCLLAEDLLRLPGGKEYVLSSDGLNLSGGQRQRVAIARAVYSRAPLMLFDDVFGSLDRRTAASILFGLCGENGLLRSMGCTVVLSTYLAECLDVADQVLILDTDTKQITLEQNRGQQHFATFLRARHVSASEVVEERQQTAILRNLDVETPNLPTGESRISSPYHPTDSKARSLFITPIGVSSLIVFYAILFIGSAGEHAPNIYMSLWIQSNPTTLLGYGRYAATFFIPILSHFIYARLQFVYNWPRACIYIHQQLLDATIRATLGFIGRADKFSILDRFGSKMECITDGLGTKLVRSPYLVSILFAHCYIVAAGFKYTSVVLPLLLTAVGLLLRLHFCLLSKFEDADSEAALALRKVFHETSNGMQYIRAFGWQASSYEAMYLALEKSQNAFYYTLFCAQLTEQSSFLLFGLMGFLAISAALFWDGSTSEAAIGLAVWHLYFAAPTIIDITRTFRSLKGTFAVLADLYSFVVHTPRERVSGDVELPPNWPVEGRVEFRDVTARYSSEMSPILHNISLSIQPGEKVCLFGRTGSGKTSLLLALLGFLEYEGTIEVDGLDIKSIPLDSLRSHVITISQDQVKLDGTIRSNLLPYELTQLAGETETELRAAHAEMDNMAIQLLTDLGVWGTIEDLGGLYTPMQNANFSRGMLQLICFARAVLRYHHTCGKLVVIDEATSSMDLWQDKAVQEGMWEFFEGCTILQVAHLKESTKDAELSVEMSSGRIVHTRRGPAIPPGVETRSRALPSPVSIIESLDSDVTSPNRRIRPSTTAEEAERPGWMPPGPSVMPAQAGELSSYLTSSGYLTSSVNSTTSSYIGSSSSYNQQQSQAGVLPWEENILPSIETDDFAGPSHYGLNMTGGLAGQGMASPGAFGAPQNGVYVATEIANYWPAAAIEEGHDMSSGSNAMASSGHASTSLDDEEQSSGASEGTSRPNNQAAGNDFMFH